MIDPGPASGFGKVAVLETCHYMRNQLLRDTDWASMAHSLEVRLPLVDHRLLQQLAAPLAAASQVDGKTLLSGSLATSLPTEVLRRTKTGFSIPIQRWLEQSPELDAWRKVPTLARTGCHWARRLAYAIGELQLDQ
jgi:asparagine synthase (glutamine-hydrolysing)